jgi:hypothetical protein
MAIPLTRTVINMGMIAMFVIVVGTYPARTCLSRLCSRLFRTLTWYGYVGSIAIQVATFWCAPSILVRAFTPASTRDNHVLVPIELIYFVQ